MNRKKVQFQIGETLIPGLALLFVLAFLIQTRGASMTVMRWPYMMLAITAIFWLGIVARYVFFGAGEEQKPAFDPKQLLVPALMIVAPVIYLVAMPYLGFAVSTFLFLPTLFRLLGSRSWKANLVTALIMTVVLQLSMIMLLKMNLPRLEIGSFIL